MWGSGGQPQAGRHRLQAVWAGRVRSAVGETQILPVCPVYHRPLFHSTGAIGSGRRISSWDEGVVRILHSNYTIK